VNADPRDRRLAWAIFLLTLGVYLLGMSSEKPWGEGEQLYEVAEAIVERGTVEVTWLAPPVTFPGPDGRVYAHYPILPSLVLVPALWLLQLAGPRWFLFLMPLLTQFAPALLASAGCAAFFALCRRIGIRPRVAFAAAAMLGFSTLLWVYSRRPQGEALELVCFVAFVLTIVRLRDRATRRDALALGVVGGLLLNTDLVFWSAIVVGFAVAIWELRARNPAGLRSLSWTAFGFLPLFALFLFYNQLRWGSPWVTGYEDIEALASENPLWGSLGLLVSPGRSVFLFSPPLLLSIYAWPRFWRARRRLAIVLLLVTLPAMLTAAGTQYWNGGLCWGPRVWLFAVPVGMLPLVSWMDELVGRPRSRLRGLALSIIAAVALVGGAVQVLGNAFYWDHYLRFSQQTQRRWLGKPNRKATPLKNERKPHCEPCVEDMYAVVWVPAFQPILGHAWMMRHAIAETDPREALEDAPWRGYTELDLDVSSVISRRRFDWWGTLWMDKFPERKPAGLAFLGAFGLVFLSGVGASWLGLRRVRPEAKAQPEGEPDPG
jgi:hypothetical protein